MGLVAMSIITLSSVPTNTQTPVTSSVSTAAVPTSSSYSDGPIVPFAYLGACSYKCAPLFDAQAECSPPVTSAVDDSCFCQNSRLEGLNATSYSDTSNICPSADCSLADLAKMLMWFQKYCFDQDLYFVGSVVSESETSTVTVTETPYAYLNAAAAATTSPADNASPSSSSYRAALAAQTGANSTASAAITSSVVLASSTTSSLPSASIVKTSDARTSFRSGKWRKIKLGLALGGLGLLSMLA